MDGICHYICINAMQQHTRPRVYLTCFTTTMLTLVSKLSIIFTFTSFQQFIVLIFHFTGLRNVCGRLFLFHTTAKPFVKQVKDFMIQKHEKKNRMKRERERQRKKRHHTLHANEFIIVRHEWIVFV